MLHDCSFTVYSEKKAGYERQQTNTLLLVCGSRVTAWWDEPINNRWFLLERNPGRDRCSLLCPGGVRGTTSALLLYCTGADGQIQPVEAYVRVGEKKGSIV